MVAGLDAARRVFEYFDAAVESTVSESDRIEAGDAVLRVSGAAAGILRAERVTVNVVGHCSGIATMARKAVDAAHEITTDVGVAATRKTTPGLRGLEKRAVEYAETIPSPHTEIVLVRLGGAINRIPVDATAYPHRDVEYLMNVHTRWEDAAQDEECLAWVGDLYDDMAPHAMGGAYVNFITEREGEEDVPTRRTTSDWSNSKLSGTQRPCSG